MEDAVIYNSLPTIAMRGIVVFPKMRLNFEIVRDKSVAAVNAAIAENQLIFMVAQTNLFKDDPKADDLFKMGVIAEVKQIMRTPSGDHVNVVVEGLYRAQIINADLSGSYYVADVEKKTSLPIKASKAEYAESLVHTTKQIFDKYCVITTKNVREVESQVYKCENPDLLGDFIAGNIIQDYIDRQKILEQLDPVARLEQLCGILLREIDAYAIEQELEERVQKQMDENQNEYYLREKMKAIAAELGEGDDPLSEIDEYKTKIRDIGFAPDIEEKLLHECDKLAKMQGGSADANVIRVYLDTCLGLPWNVYTEDNFNLDRARKILDGDHYGLEKIKERFIEMLAVRSLTSKLGAQIICLVGPPGVGKTSIVKSIAKAMGRKYVRLSLGGVHDEAEIRGHRKTYVGAMPGRIITAIKQAGSFNPVILLDEVDKLGSDYRGDPSSALLEALDPEQNNTFTDHYIEFPVDLSKIIFITTANDSSTIPSALYDRMETIELTSYTLEDKLMIAKNHLVKKQRELHGLNGRKIRFSDDALKYLIDGYTREAGVRRLEQLIAAVCRKTAVMLSDGEAQTLSVNRAVIEKMLGPAKFKPENLSKNDLVGVVNGLAWTSVGGEMLQVEAVVMDGSGKLELTGSLGDVMKESAKAAHSYIRSVASVYGIDKDIFKNKDIHIHVPQGAVPKDGPSAGVTISTALLSALTGRKVKSSVAMTGEISLTGRVMPIGGLKEKSMAAFKSGIRTVIIPEENESDLWEVDKAVKEAVEFIPVKTLDEVFSVALCESRKAEPNNIEKKAFTEHESKTRDTRYRV